MNEIQYRLVKGEKDKDIMRAVLLSERNYYKYKKKISLHLEEIQKERTDSAIWLEVQTLKDRMSNLYSVLYMREFRDPHTKTSDLSNLVSTAESIAINILKLESCKYHCYKTIKHIIRKSYKNTITFKIQIPTRTSKNSL